MVAVSGNCVNRQPSFRWHHQLNREYPTCFKRNNRSSESVDGGLAGTAWLERNRDQQQPKTTNLIGAGLLIEADCASEPRGIIFDSRVLIDFGVFTQNHFVKCMEHVLGTGLRDLFLLSCIFSFLNRSAASASDSGAAG